MKFLKIKDTFARFQVSKFLRTSILFSISIFFVITIFYLVAYEQCNCEFTQLSFPGVMRIIIDRDWQTTWIFTIPVVLIVAEVFFTGWNNSSFRMILKFDLSVKKDLFYWFLNYSKTVEIIIFVTTFGIFSYFLWPIQNEYSLKLQGNLAPGYQLAIGFIVNDFVAYWTHRWLHSSSLLWQFHRIHHSATTLNILTSQRTHPLEIVIWKLEQVFIFLLLGASTATFLIFNIIYMVSGQIQHARLRWGYGILGKLIVSPTFHRLHHSIASEDADKNFGPRLVIWDIMFGTYSAKNIEIDAIGVDGVSSDKTPILLEFVRPYKVIWSKASTAFAKDNI